MTPQEKSGGVKSGDLGGHSPREITLFGNEITLFGKMVLLQPCSRQKRGLWPHRVGNNRV
jgi:hypothetical protein